MGNEELLKYQDAVVKASEEQLKQGLEQFKVGKILESDYLLLEAQYANDKNNILDTKISRDNSLLTLKGLLSMHPENELQIIYPDTTAILEMSLMPSLNSVLERTIETLPDIKISKARNCSNWNRIIESKLFSDNQPQWKHRNRTFKRLFKFRRSIIRQAERANRFVGKLSINLIVPVPEHIIVSKAKVPEFKKWVVG